MNNNEYEYEDNIYGEELEEVVKHSLKYLLDEGIVVKTGNKFRLKTQKEIDQDLQSILKD